MLVIPAIDLRNSQVVRLFQGNYDKTKVYGKDPLSYAKMFEDLGAQRIHIVDLDGAKEGKPVHKELILKIASQVKAFVQVGGGIRKEEDIKTYIEGGISQVILGTKAVESKEWLKRVCEKFPRRIIVSVDIKGDKVAIAGWLKVSEYHYQEFLKSLDELPLFGIIVTAIERDGTQEGVNTELVEKVLSYTKHPVFVAGGVSTIEDIKKLKKLSNVNKNLLGVITGRAIYEGTLDLREALEVAQNGL
ncbi:MAG: 1-(5-phosphoribosyl)-5-[(5-phosphoribosylamino)methylideneamino]imidazole-4-carboxamide isomerase [Thermodesulfobacteria bacterium]|nr:1-(5-phosphoribosyl)-5-[(5-phosphoribosylamino)methylideneamino]imidazole-4-carboxamide isomerase [Thermodesulfobacteriota bacterium]